mmetsp:Transcript_97315/g.225595  ORF Transcript_97315/g.225595 Transcript_97315/m.225595 type:complete len:178 (-) Transcript_97315:22-555(-)
MAVVCISILDYLLTYGTWQVLQNTVQRNRWTDYEDKLRHLVMCVGWVQQTLCWEYQDMADEAWLDEAMRRYNLLMKVSFQRELINSVQRDFRCCCYTGGGMPSAVGFTGRLKWTTPCEWQAFSQEFYGPRTSSKGFCSHDAVHWDPSQGGCARIRAPDLNGLQKHDLLVGAPDFHFS